ncbi:NAD(P)/FAD-dependent oxidoreductase [Maritalea myrionectae]|uniref:NAD(P)/FAD-dependent oxidoreductase n=1 Tax=Maritalea myrionectae TaxID=454601 RepID=UPI0003FADEC9|nr:NAD(P)/FAD-dependent oxidoreductase [Maritalea myrionectae]
MHKVDVLIIGAGAAGMLAAAEAGKRGRRVLLVDHAKKAGDKIRISGGGRCNFTNVNTSFKQFLSENPHFAISPLKRFSAQDFIGRVRERKIAFHEKTLGQLFCDESAQQIIDMLLNDLRDAGVELRLKTSVHGVQKTGDRFVVELDDGQVEAEKLVVATGGKSIPKMGATSFGYDLASQFGLRVVETRPGLVPLTFDQSTLAPIKELAGVALDPVQVSRGKVQFNEALLFTHRGLSGPAILQISSFWREGDQIKVNMLPGQDIFDQLRAARQDNGKRAVQTVLGQFLPKRVVEFVINEQNISGNLADMSDKKLKNLSDRLAQWVLKPTGSEGYRTAEVTLGGVATDELDNRTMEAKKVPGLYFIGEVVDMTGWLGGYNFQWAWSSAWVAGQAV